MKKNSTLGVLGMAMMLATSNEIVEQGRVISSNKSNAKRMPRKHVHLPFHKEEGVLKMIADYNLIKKGESKKGIIKQTRIKNKIDEWLKSGMLKEEYLNL